MAWELLRPGGSVSIETGEATCAASRTRFSEDRDVVVLGADAYPGVGVDASSRTSMLACLAHELAHAERFRQGFGRPVEMADGLLDEAEASVHASFTPVLNMKDREDLIEHARDRLNQWLEENNRRRIAHEGRT